MSTDQASRPTTASEMPDRDVLAALIDDVVMSRRALIQQGVEIEGDLPHAIADAVLATHGATTVDSSVDDQAPPFVTAAPEDFDGNLDDLAQWAFDQGIAWGRWDAGRRGELPSRSQGAPWVPSPDVRARMEQAVLDNFHGPDDKHPSWWLRPSDVVDAVLAAGLSSLASGRCEWGVQYGASEYSIAKHTEADARQLVAAVPSRQLKQREVSPWRTVPAGRPTEATVAHLPGPAGQSSEHGVDRVAVARAAALVHEYVETGGQAHEVIRADRLLTAVLNGTATCETEYFDSPSAGAGTAWSSDRGALVSLTDWVSRLRMDTPREQEHVTRLVTVLRSLSAVLAARGDEVPELEWGVGYANTDLVDRRSSASAAAVMAHEAGGHVMARLVFAWREARP